MYVYVFYIFLINTNYKKYMRILHFQNLTRIWEFKYKNRRVKSSDLEQIIQIGLEIFNYDLGPNNYFLKLEQKKSASYILCF